MTAAATSCQNCTHWAPKKAGAMARHGYGICSLNFVWKFFAPRHTCNKHKQADIKVVAARAVWLEKKK